MTEPAERTVARFDASDVIKAVGMLAAAAITAASVIWSVGTKTQAIQDRLDQQVVALSEVRQLVTKYSDRENSIQVEIATLRASCCVPRAPVAFTPSPGATAAAPP